MLTEQQILKTSIPVSRDESRESRLRRRSLTWMVVLGICGAAGLFNVITGLMLSLLPACGLVENTRNLSFVVTALIITGLGALLWGAHAIDRVEELRHGSKQPLKSR